MSHGDVITDSPGIVIPKILEFGSEVNLNMIFVCVCVGGGGILSFQALLLGQSVHFADLREHSQAHSFS